MINPNVKTEVICGDCISVMDNLPAESVEAIVTDPPYGISMMGKEWDHSVPGIPFWESALRVAKPGAYLLAMGSPRTFHRLAVNIEDAGWELRNTIMWVHGQGFPKSVNVGKQIDKKMGIEREIIGVRKHLAMSTHNSNDGWKRPSHYDLEGNPKTTVSITRPASPEAKQWDGWGSDLKPAHEPILMFRKPLKGTIADNVLQYGCGAINIDACRVGVDTISTHNAPKGTFAGGELGRGSDTSTYKQHEGRFPANFCHDGSDEVLALFPQTNKSHQSFRGVITNAIGLHLKNILPDTDYMRGHDDNGGSAARFFYCAKPSTAERELGCEALDEQKIVTFSTCNNTSGKPSAWSEGRNTVRRNDHISVKPLALMRYLIKMVCPVGSIVLDPFAGSGTTGMAAQHEGVNSILIDIDQHYCDIAKARNLL